MKMLHCSRSNAQLQHREEVKAISFVFCQDITQAGPFKWSQKRHREKDFVRLYLVGGQMCGVARW